MKKWYKSKAIWGGIITTIPAVFAVISPYLDPNTQETLKSLYQAILPLGMGLGIVGIRSMKEPIGENTNKFM
jgi:hypothetical protein